MEERIFNHLLRQSDPGIEFGMKEEFGDAVEEDDDDDEEGGGGGEEENGEGEDDDDLAEDVVNGGAEDPRAGSVDVFLPQLQVVSRNATRMLGCLLTYIHLRAKNHLIKASWRS